MALLIIGPVIQFLTVGFHESEIVGCGGRGRSSFAKMGPKVVPGESIDNECINTKVHGPIGKLICLMQKQPPDQESHLWGIGHDTG